MSAGLASLLVPLSLATQGPGASAFPWPWVFGLVFIFYFMLLRPQQKEQKKRREMLGSLKKNDKVVTTSGMFGQIVALDDHTVTLKVDENVRIRFSRAAIDRSVVEPVPEKA